MQKRQKVSLSTILESPVQENGTTCAIVEEQIADKKSPTAALYYLVLFQQESDINRTLVRGIQRKLDEIIDTSPTETEIDVWIESPGGDAHAAYKLGLDLRSRCRKLRGVVPDYAKSAGTLLLLGVDEIFMAPAAELGPLDVQIEHPDRAGVRISGLDLADSLEHLAKSAVDLVISGGASILDSTRLSRQDVLHETLNFMSRLLQPIVAKLDPHLIHQAALELDVAENYAVDLLRRRNMDSGLDMTRRQARMFMRHLVKHYPAHGYVISRDEARTLNLPIKNAETYARWSYVQKEYLKFEDSGEDFIYVMTDSDIDELEVEILPNEPKNQEVREDEENRDS